MTQHNHLSNPHLFFIDGLRVISERCRFKSHSPPNADPVAFHYWGSGLESGWVRVQYSSQRAYLRAPTKKLRISASPGARSPEAQSRYRTMLVIGIEERKKNINSINRTDPENKKNPVGN